VVQAVTFLFLVSLFGLTGSRAPTAIIAEDRGPYGKAFIAQLAAAHHSLDLRFMKQAEAEAALQRGDVVAILTIPADFSDAIAAGKDVSIPITIDNVNADMTADVERALPSAIVAFSKQVRTPGIRIQVAESDLVDHDTGFIPYLVVSGLGLDAFVIACLLSAMAVAREFEAGTIKLLAVAPVHPLFSILGRVMASDLVATLAMILPVGLTILGYHILPLHPLAMISVLLLSVAIFSCIGVALGAVLKRTLPVASFVFGLALPLYLCSGSLEPQRFDGVWIWVIAHISPVYYAVGILEWAFHGLQVTPEPMWFNFMALAGWAALMLLSASVLLRTTLIEKTSKQRVAEGQGKRLQAHHILLRGSRLWPRRRSAFADLNWLWQGRGGTSPGWLALVFIPLLVGSGIWFNMQQNLLQGDVTQQQRTAREIATDQRQATLLLNYQNQITDLALHRNLLHAKKTDKVIVEAGTFTRETLHQLNPTRKASLLLFLYHLKLLGEDTHIDLQRADLRGGQFVNLDLHRADLSGADFSGADLRGSNLHFANLTSANFSGANLAGADLSGAEMRGTIVTDANLAEANLARVTGISSNELGKARSLAGTTLPDGSAPSKDDEGSE
jgi:ABC-2 type transport system permease protein